MFCFVLACHTYIHIHILEMDPTRVYRDRASDRRDRECTMSSEFLQIVLDHISIPNSLNRTQRKTGARGKAGFHPWRAHGRNGVAAACSFHHSCLFSIPEYILEPPPCRAEPEDCNTFCTQQEECPENLQCCSAYCGIVCSSNKAALPNT